MSLNVTNCTFNFSFMLYVTKLRTLCHLISVRHFWYCNATQPKFVRLSGDPLKMVQNAFRITCIIHSLLIRRQTNRAAWILFVSGVLLFQKPFIFWESCVFIINNAIIKDPIWMYINQIFCQLAEQRQENKKPQNAEINRESIIKAKTKHLTNKNLAIRKSAQTRQTLMHSCKQINQLNTEPHHNGRQVCGHGPHPAFLTR